MVEMEAEVRIPGYTLFPGNMLFRTVELYSNNKKKDLSHDKKTAEISDTVRSSPC